MKAMLIAICVVLAFSAPTFAQEDNEGGDDGGASEQTTESADEPSNEAVEPNEAGDALLDAFNTACAADQGSSECQAAAKALIPDASGVKHVLVNTQ